MNNQIKAEIEKIIQTKASAAWAKLIFSNANILAELKEFGNLLNITDPKQQLYCYINNTTPKLCKFCNKNTAIFNSFQKGYREACSITCKQSGHRQKLLNYWQKHPGNMQVRMPIMQQTLKERTGYKFALQDPISKQKAKDTTIERFGVEYAIQCQECKDKQEATVYERFGCKNVQQNKEIKSKTLNTLAKRYGVSNVSQTHFSSFTYQILNNKELFTNALSKTNASQLADDLGVSYFTILKYHSDYGLKLTKNNGSRFEDVISNWLKSINVNNFIQNDRKILNKKELDFYIPESNLAIEFNGLYWHSENGSRNKFTKYTHKIKSENCAKQSINLIHIFEDEWLNKADICKSIIKQRLNISTTKIPARKCLIEEITNKDTKEFLENNHLQGWVPSTKAYALKYNNEIVQLITFGKPRYNKQVDLELIRLCTKIDTQIIGGTQKLWKHAIVNLNVNSIVSYCDRRWFSGDIYKHLGFTLKTSSKPTYWYTNYKERFHRSKFTKKNLIKLGHPADKTEAYITKNILHLDRIWDCGQDSWLWKREN